MMPGSKTVPMSRFDLFKILLVPHILPVYLSVAIKRHLLISP